VLIKFGYGKIKRTGKKPGGSILNE